MIRVKRVYEKPSKEDGFRLLVDRLWPRGMTKESAARGSVDERDCAERCAAEMVWARSGEMGTSS